MSLDPGVGGGRAFPGRDSAVPAFLPIGDDLILLLEQTVQPGVGNGAFSFTLSRTN
jgi:hypothetical protein